MTCDHVFFNGDCSACVQTDRWRAQRYLLEQSVEEARKQREAAERHQAWERRRTADLDQLRRAQERAGDRAARTDARAQRWAQEQRQPRSAARGRRQGAAIGAGVVVLIGLAGAITDPSAAEGSTVLAFLLAAGLVGYRYHRGGARSAVRLGAADSAALVCLLAALILLIGTPPFAAGIIMLRILLVLVAAATSVALVFSLAKL